MKPNKLIGLMAVSLILPSTAIAFSETVLANEVKVKTANVEAVTRSDGSVYINSGGNRVSVPSRRSSRSWNPFRYWNFPWQSYDTEKSNCRHSSYQSTKQSTRSGNHTVQSSSYSNTCN